MTEFIDTEAARKNRENIEQMKRKEVEEALKPKVYRSHNKKRDLARKQNDH